MSVKRDRVNREDLKYLRQILDRVDKLSNAGKQYLMSYISRNHSPQTGDVDAYGDVPAETAARVVTSRFPENT